MTVKKGDTQELRHWLDEATKHLDETLNALTAAALRADYRTASAISRVQDAVERAHASIPYIQDNA